jgi:hypothetical protein
MGRWRTPEFQLASDFFDVSRVLARIMERFAFVDGAGGRLLSCQLRRFWSLQ